MYSFLKILLKTWRKRFFICFSFSLLGSILNILLRLSGPYNFFSMQVQYFLNQRQTIPSALHFLERQALCLENINFITFFVSQPRMFFVVLFLLFLASTRFSVQKSQERMKREAQSSFPVQGVMLEMRHSCITSSLGQSESISKCGFGSFSAYQQQSGSFQQSGGGVTCRMSRGLTQPSLSKRLLRVGQAYSKNQQFNHSSGISCTDIGI